MIKPEIPPMAGMEAMTDAMDFMKKMWGGGGSAPHTGMPGMVMPTLSVEEINKQITDLKAVESWLTVNMNMLRGTIQALEVQSATISSLQAMSQSFSAAMMPDADADAASAAPNKKAATAGERSGRRGEAAPNTADNKKQTTASAGAKAEPTATASSTSADPAAWWNMLQNQFNQALNSALTESTPPAATAATTATSRKRKSAPRNKS